MVVSPLVFLASPMNSIADLKKAARKGAHERREAAHAATGGDAPRHLLSHVFPVSPQPGFSVVSAFYPYQSEIDTRPLLGKLAGEGWTTALPIVIAKQQPLQFRRWLPGEPTVPGLCDIPRPPEHAPLVEPNVLLVPMLAFDRKGFRLGYGGGFYDRTLALLRSKQTTLAIGVAYAAQEVDTVPHDVHDQSLDYVMTEKELFRCV